jgi:hypothetical protein
MASSGTNPDMVLLPGGVEDFMQLATDDGGWAAFYRMNDLREIASPRFARLIELAREEGLLVPLLAGDSETVEKAAAALREKLCEEVRSHCHISHTHTLRQAARDHPAAGPLPV